MLHWYALFTKPHKERRVESELIGRGIEVYFPTMQSVIAHAPRASAFFPRYMFCRFDVELYGINALAWTPGLKSVVMFGGTPARIEDRVIECLRERLAKADTFHIRGESIRPGDRVKITSGPFANLEALFDGRLSNAGRVRILVQLLQRWTAIDIEAGHIAKVPQSITRVRSFEPRIQAYHQPSFG